MSINSTLQRWKTLYDNLVKNKDSIKPSDFGLKPLVMDSHNRIYIAENLAKEMSIYVEFSTDNILNTYTFPELKGVSISRKKDIVQKGYHYLKITREAECPDEVFISLSISLADGINEAETDLKTLLLIDSVLKQYSHLFTKKTKSLGREKEQGLYCELLFLEKLIEEKGDSAIENWTGPEKNKHDFVIDDRHEVEIKSTNNEEQLIIHISNENQLDKAGLDELRLITYVVEVNNAGETVDNVISRIIKAISSADMYLQFLTDLALMEVEPNSYKGEYNFVVVKKYTFIVDDDFPRISKSNISPKIYDVKYRLNLSEVPVLSEE